MRKRKLISVLCIASCAISISACSQEKSVDRAIGTETPLAVTETAVVNPKESVDDVDEAEAIVTKAFDNPIDEYYLPRIETAEAQATRRALQDDYRIVWEHEFKNLLTWIKKKCIYEEDKENVLSMEKRAVKNIEAAREVLLIELIDGYSTNPDPKKCDGFSRISLRGNGTRSRLNQIEGEMYRDECMRIISVFDDYKFLKLDYGSVLK